MVGKSLTKDDQDQGHGKGSPTHTGVGEGKGRVPHLVEDHESQRPHQLGMAGEIPYRVSVPS